MECTIPGVYEADDCYKLKCLYPTARKQHVCEECGRVIDVGDKYELYYGVHEGHIFCVKTCIDCKSIRDSFWPDGGYIFGSIIDALREQIIYELHGEVSSKCILPLTDNAKNTIFELIEEAWAV